MKQTDFSYRTLTGIKTARGYAFKAAGRTWIADRRALFGRHAAWIVTDAATGAARHGEWQTLKAAIADTVTNGQKEAAAAAAAESRELFKPLLNQDIRPIYDIWTASGSLTRKDNRQWKEQSNSRAL